VSFKLFGGIGLMLAFTIGQGLYISRHIKPETAESRPASAPGPLP
jgi:intracellular septation protein